MKKGAATSEMIDLIIKIILVIVVIGMAIFANLKIRDSKIMEHQKISRDIALTYDAALFSPHDLKLNYKIQEKYHVEKIEECKIQTLHIDEMEISKLSYYLILYNNSLICLFPSHQCVMFGSYILLFFLRDIFLEFYNLILNHVGKTMLHHMLMQYLYLSSDVP